MRRRTLLVGVGALAAGCLESPTQTSDSSQTPTNRSPPSVTTSPSETSTDAEYRLTDLSQSTSVDRPSVKYVLEPSAFYSADAVEREEDRIDEEQVVVDVSDIDDDTVRRAIETAIRDGEWRSNTAPEGLTETVERVDFFTGVSVDGPHTHVGLTLHRFDPDSPPAVEFSASVVDDTVSATSPGAVEFTLANRSETTQLVYAGTVPPFGAVFAQAVDSDDRFLLWREYEEEGCISFSEEGMMACSIGSITELAPSDGVTRRYEVLPTGTTTHPRFTVPPGPGTYRVTDSVSYAAERGAPGSTLSVEVEFTLESV